MDWSSIFSNILSFLGTISVLLGGLFLIAKLFGWLDDVMVWVHKAKDALTALPEDQFKILKRLDTQDEEIKQIKNEFAPNGGKSMSDRVEVLDDRQKLILDTVLGNQRSFEQHMIEAENWIKRIIELEEKNKD